MNAVWVFLWVGGIVYGLFSGKADELLGSAAGSASDAITLCLALAASYALWSGFLNILAKAGLLAKLASVFKKPIKWLFPGADKEASEAIAANLSANALGLGNAATPAGIRASVELAKNHPQNQPNHALLMLIVINSTSIQLIPTTVISLRALAGSMQPSAIVIPTIIATTASTCMGIIFACIARAKKS